MSITDGVAETALGVTGSETPAKHPRDTEIGELARPFAARWFPGSPIHRERCVGAIRDFILSGTFKQWRDHRPAAEPCWQCQGYGLYVPASDITAAPVPCPACKGVGR